MLEESQDAIYIRIDPITSSASVETLEDGLKTFKEITMEGLVKVLLQSIQKDVDEKISTPLLPIEMGSMGTLAYQEKNTNRYSVLIYVPETTEDIVFEQEKYLIKYPPCIYKAEVNNKFLCGVWVWCLDSKTKVITPDTTVYSYPFYNVSRNGNICFNRDNYFPVEEPYELRKLPYIHRQLPSVGHLGNNNKSGLLSKSLFKKLVSRKDKTFPDEWLMPYGNVKNIIEE